MRNRKFQITVLAIALLILGPMLVDRWLSWRDAHYDRVVITYECESEICKADFNGDGVLDHLIVDRMNALAPEYDSWLLVIDGKRELLRLPRRRIDNTLRTHVAIRNELGGARLLVFDEIKGAGTPINAVFAWNGERMVQVLPLDADREILTAMAARDDAGTFFNWVLYRWLRAPILVGYYILLTSIIILTMIRWKLR